MMLQAFETDITCSAARSWMVPVPEPMGPCCNIAWAPDSTHVALLATPPPHMQQGHAQLMVVRLADRAYRWAAGQMSAQVRSQRVLNQHVHAGTMSWSRLMGLKS